ncbi:MAG: hypothetical protein HRT68_03155 [Flavobacteriaceae bacterium]|nr:hypothetical protein [Flavobacteriaceae bacterium]
MKKIFLLLLASALFSACMEKAERNCSDFKNGSFEYTYMDNGVEKTSTFTRNGDLEIDYYDDKIDTITIKWINECEYIARSKHPKSLSEKDAFHFKILSTTENSYTFEYGKVVKNKKNDYVKFRGTAYKTN